MKHKIARIFIALLIALANALVILFLQQVPQKQRNQNRSKLPQFRSCRKSSSHTNFSSYAYHRYSNAIPDPKPAVTAAPTVTPHVVNSSPPKQTLQTLTVYITKTGKKYYRDGCQYLSKSKISLVYRMQKVKDTGHVVSVILRSKETGIGR
ncbi:hypothetical protein [Desulfosporosinus sp. Sb-LF]|uniref:hypothetical protein n=1 Tax=Desulfosporosinus sp. Sb-LF TaxID=2560027 RepID=UPI00107F197F|nr:hypothetical protein [Desulfosporosinus sp. Sb-LF]TGE33186.1 hypothetical protein E4K68_06670 [Desulfosporosinus sp. Sb-LF]